MKIYSKLFIVTCGLFAASSANSFKFQSKDAGDLENREEAEKIVKNIGGAIALTIIRPQIMTQLKKKIRGTDNTAMVERKKELTRLFHHIPIISAQKFYEELVSKSSQSSLARLFNRKLSSYLRNKLLNILLVKQGKKTREISNKTTNSNINVVENISCHIDSNNDADSHYYKSLDSISEVLKKIIPVSNKRAIAARRTLLNCLFEQFPPLYADYFRAELGDSIMENEISRVFHGRLSGTVARELLSKLGSSINQQSIDANKAEGSRKVEDSYESIRQLVMNNLQIEDAGWGDELEDKLAERPARLVRVFNRMPKDSAWDFHTELGLEDNGSKLSRFFHTRLSYELRDQLLGILWERSAPSQEQQFGDSNVVDGSKQVEGGYEHIRELIWNDLLEIIGKQDVTAMVKRSERLVREFNRVPKDSAWAFYNELGEKNNGGEFSKLFHEKLSYVLKEELLGILWELSRQ